jgi:hypothetical protein
MTCSATHGVAEIARSIRGRRACARRAAASRAPRACDGTSRSRADWHRGARNGSSCSWTWVTRRPQPLFGDWGKGSLPGAYCALVRFSSSASIAASILPLTAFSRARTSASGSRSKSLTRPARYSSRSSSKVPTEANGWRSTARRSIARLVPQPGREASSHGPPAQLLRDSAARLRNDGEKVYCLSQWVPFDHSIE